MLHFHKIVLEFHKACETAGIGHHRIHDLRHSFITNAITSGADIVSVSKYVGHTDIETTLNKYSHLLKERERSMIADLERLY